MRRYTDKKLTPMLEKGGCRHCKLDAKGLGGHYCTASALPPDDEVTLNCVLKSTAAECCAPPAWGWGWTLLSVLVLGGGMYAGGGIAYNFKTNGVAPSAEALPHREHWMNILSLVQDGVAYSQRRMLQSKAAGLITKLTGKKLGGPGPYSPLPSAALGGGGGGGGGEGAVGGAAGGGGSPTGGGAARADWAKANGDETDMFGGGSSSSGSGSASGSDTDDDIVE